MRRVLLGMLLAALLTALILTPAALVLAQGQPTPTPAVAGGGNPADTFPAALGYAALGLATTVWGVMSGVIAKLWKRNSDQQEGFQKTLKDEKAALRTSWEEERKDLLTKNSRLQERIDKEIEERRAEAVTYLKEALTTQNALQKSLDAVEKAIQDLTDVVNSWTEQ